MRRAIVIVSLINVVILYLGFSGIIINIQNAEVINSNNKHSKYYREVVGKNPTESIGLAYHAYKLSTGSYIFNILTSLNIIKDKRNRREYE